jgi:exodeoxyribonuclease VII large subunit
MQPEAVELGVGEFVALLNQTLEYAYGGVVITGELSNLRISKNRWVYFDLKDDEATVKFFGSVYQLPGPLEDGMVLKVRGTPKLHNLYGFSVNLSSIRLAGEGTIKKAAELLKAKLLAEGLFDPGRKRSLPFPPQRIGLVTSRQSAAYADFIKIINARWHGLDIELIDVQVQGEAAPAQIAAAIEQFNEEAATPDVLVLIRGGGSAEDLASFSTEQVTRAVAASRVPTLVAIGHEVDVCLAELAADRRASTPSNAAELLVPDRREVLAALKVTEKQLENFTLRRVAAAAGDLKLQSGLLSQLIDQRVNRLKTGLAAYAPLLNALNPEAVLRRGYAVVRHNGRALRSAQGLQSGNIVDIQLAGGSFSAAVKKGKDRA